MIDPIEAHIKHMILGPDADAGTAHIAEVIAKAVVDITHECGTPYTLREAIGHFSSMLENPA